MKTIEQRLRFLEKTIGITENYKDIKTESKRRKLKEGIEYDHFKTMSLDDQDDYFCEWVEDNYGFKLVPDLNGSSIICSVKTNPKIATRINWIEEAIDTFNQRYDKDYAFRNQEKYSTKWDMYYEIV